MIHFNTSEWLEAIFQKALEMESSPSKHEMSYYTILLPIVDKSAILVAISGRSFVSIALNINWSPRFGR